MYEVKATDSAAGGKLACEIYPDVFVIQGGGVISTYAGQANGVCPCDPLPPDVDASFEISDSQLDDAVEWATSIHEPESSRYAPRPDPSATKRNYSRLKASYDLGLIVEAARCYLDAAIAHPRDTVGKNWGIACLPSWEGTRVLPSHGYLVFIDLGSGWGMDMSAIMEGDVVRGYTMTVEVDRRTLEEESGQSLPELERRFADDVTFTHPTHSVFEGRAVSLSTEASASNVAFPAGLRWQRAAAVLADRLLLDEGNRSQRELHNQWLAEDVLRAN
ncbi:hypothetical protein [Rhodococcus sp. NPDC049939]|uniref:hypothetical protein n=1 Tax=Rhodococcus sp. NPDC049939 TaxID=3155511 RepID=UPI0033C37B39